MFCGTKVGKGFEVRGSRFGKADEADAVLGLSLRGLRFKLAQFEVYECVPIGLHKAVVTVIEPVGMSRDGDEDYKPKTIVTSKL